MQIQLKQPEIQAALRMYVASQGINLSGKVVDISFTAGRGANGLAAEINIDEATGQLPDFAPEVIVPTLTVVSAADPVPQPEADEAAPEPVKATTSLFN